MKKTIKTFNKNELSAINITKLPETDCEKIQNAIMLLGPQYFLIASEILQKNYNFCKKILEKSPQTFEYFPVTFKSDEVLAQVAINGSLKMDELNQKLNQQLVTKNLLSKQTKI